jgi:hypothetical protein
MTRAQKLALRGYLRKYPDGRLAELLAHAQDGKLSYGSCCCFVGCLTADHPLRHPESGPMTGSIQHIYHARELDSGSREKLGPAERAFMEIASGDADRRRLVIPLIRAEMKRRVAPPSACEAVHTAQRAPQSVSLVLAESRLPGRKIAFDGYLPEARR